MDHTMEEGKNLDDQTMEEGSPQQSSATEHKAADLVTLNVGGSLYTTTVATLTRYPVSILGRMFKVPMPFHRDSNGNYIIDRDGPIFRHILNFLRLSSLCLPSDFKEWDLLSAEADFFEIKELIDAVKKKRVQKIEFIEISFSDKEDKVTYRGHPKILNAIPFLAQDWKPYEKEEINAGNSGMNERLITVPKDVGREIDRTKMYQEMTELGFSMLEMAPNLKTILFWRNTE